MRPALLYRIAAVLLALFAVSHTFGFQQVDPQWGVDAVVSQMKTASFQILGVQRTYWEFFIGLGLLVTILQLFAAAVAWQLATIGPAVLARMSLVRWGFALAFVAVTGLNLRYFFAIPLTFSVVITLCLILAAWSGGRTGTAGSGPQATN